MVVRQSLARRALLLVADLFSLLASLLSCANRFLLYTIRAALTAENRLLKLYRQRYTGSTGV